MANFNDEDDGGMALQMIPKPGMQGATAQQMQNVQPQTMQGQAANMRPVLAQAGSDRQAAQQGWEQALRQNVGMPVQNAASGVADKLDAMFGNGPKGATDQRMQQIQPRGMDDQMDALRQQMLAERAANGGQMSPESMQRFQRLKAALMGGQQPGAVAAQPEQTQED